MRMLLLRASLAIAAALLIGWIGRLRRTNRATEKTIYHSMMKEWKHDD